MNTLVLILAFLAPIFQDIPQSLELNEIRTILQGLRAQVAGTRLRESLPEE